MITVLDTTPLIAPVYNPMYIRVSSDQTLQEGFSFVFDLYVNNIFITSTKLPPIPGTTECVYSPARILESYVSYDLSQNTVGCVDSANCIDKYEIKIAEEYVQYWNYFNNTSDTYTSSLYTILTHPSNTHFFNPNDQILVTQTPGFSYAGYSGIHKVLSVPNNKALLMDVLYVPTPINGGRVCYADKRKSRFYL